MSGPQPFKSDRFESAPPSIHHGPLQENIPPPAEDLKAGVPKDTLYKIDQVLVISAPKESPQDKDPVAKDVPKEIIFFGDIPSNPSNPPVLKQQKKKNKLPTTGIFVVKDEVSHRTLTPEIMRLEALQKAITAEAAASPSEIPAFIREQISPSVRPGSPQPVILPYNSVRALINDLASRALAKGYRQPVNFLYKNAPDHDTWNLAVKMGQYYYTECGVYVGDHNDPVEFLTENTGMVRYEMWCQVWNKMREGYLNDSLLPDIRAVVLHKDMTYKLIPLIKSELDNLKKERCREGIYTEQQKLKLRRGIKERMVWLEDMEACIRYLRIFQDLLDELPDDAMMSKKWFDKGFEKGVKDVDYGVCE
ncbi:hypothetical protein TWF281_002948 [Arthrobotrys megalospora]